MLSPMICPAPSRTVIPMSESEERDESPLPSSPRMLVGRIPPPASTAAVRTVLMTRLTTSAVVIGLSLPMSLSSIVGMLMATSPVRSETPGMFATRMSMLLSVSVSMVTFLPPWFSGAALVSLFSNRLSELRMVL